MNPFVLLTDLFIEGFFMFVFSESIEKLNSRKFGSLNFSQGSAGFEFSVDWIVDKFIPKKSFGVLYGPSGSLKSFLAVDLCCSLACGMSWGGYEVKEGAVVYVAGEGELGLKMRVKGWETNSGRVVKNLYILGQGMVMSESQNQEDLILAIKEIERQDNVKVELVVLDTLARCYSGDENTSRDMTAFVNGCDNVKVMADTAVLCIHHSGRDETRGARGSSALRAACDFEYQVKRKLNSNTILLKNTKQKDGAEAPDIEMNFDIIELPAKDKNGENLTSLAKVSLTRVTERSDDVESPVLVALKNKPDFEITRAELRTVLFNKGTLSDAQRKSMSRMLKKLELQGRISIEQNSFNRASDDDKIFLIH
ncbi:AAA family ATPase [Vibrio owensii]